MNLSQLSTHAGLTDALTRVDFRDLISVSLRLQCLHIGTRKRLGELTYTVSYLRISSSVTHDIFVKTEL